MTNHPLNETAAAEVTDEMRRAAASAYEDMAQVTRPENHEKCLNAALTAALAVSPTEDDRPWEPLNKHDPLHVGDEVRRDHGGTTSIAVVGRVDKSGDPWTAEGKLIGLLRYGTWYVRRPVPELPTKCGTVIVANDGHKFIKAEVDGIAHRAREAVLGANGWWYGAWRKAEGDGLLSAMFPEHISAPTWKVDDQ